MRWYNPIVAWLLRSPLHGIFSGSVMLVKFTGRKSGKTYTTPVEYCYDGDSLVVFSAADRVWWKNLLDAAPVSVRIKGRDIEGMAKASINDADLFAKAFRAYLERYPGREKYFDVRLDANGTLNNEDIARVAGEQAVIHITLKSS